MYELLGKIELIYSSMIVICIMIFPFTIEKDKFLWNTDSEETKYEEKEYRWKKIVRNIILLLAVGIGVVGYIWLVWNKEYIWILFPITLLTFLERMNEAYVSIGIVRKTLHSGGDELLSIREQVSIMTIALFVGILSIYRLPEKCLKIVESFQNEAISDVLLLVVLILFVTIYYLLLGAMLLIPIKALIRLGRVIKTYRVSGTNRFL